MAALVETMFNVREKLWHGLGTIVMEAPSSSEALRLAGLDWNVVQEPIYTDFNEPVEGYRANVRDSDRKVLGVVSDRYKVVQNTDAFSFTDELLGRGVRYETAGSLQEGKKVWLLARLPREYIIAGERISPYLVFSNTHDGSGSVKVAITPVRVVCNNTLNLALNTAKRSFSMIHTGNIQDKIQEARDTLFMAEEFEAILEERKKYERCRSRRSTVFHDYGYICCSSYSGKPRSKDFHWRHYKELLKKAGLPDIRWHDLRSTYCTLLLNKDFNPKAVSKLMGHAKELITMDVYGDNANIIPEEIPELLSYMEEVMPDRFRDDVTESTMRDIMVDVDKYLPKRKKSEEDPN